MKLTDAAGDFLAHLEEIGKSESTRRTSARAAALLVGYLGEEKEVEKILPVHISKFFGSDAVMKQPGKGGLKPRADISVKQIRRITRQFLFWCAEQGMVERAPLPKDEAGLGSGLRSGGATLVIEAINE